MNRRSETALTLAVDAIMIQAAFALYYLVRIRSGWLAYAIEPELMLPNLVLCAFWILWMFFFGLYGFSRLDSRFNELVALFRSTGFGVLLLFFLIFIDDQSVQSSSNSRLLIVGYWAILVGMLSLGRLTMRYVQKRLLASGIGLQNALIVGWSKQAFHLCDTVLKFPVLGHRVVGFVRPSGGTARPAYQNAVTGRPASNPPSYKSIPQVGVTAELPRLIEQHHIAEILVGLESSQHNQLLEVLRLCEGKNVGLKIMPDLYDIVSGQARISSLYGTPLMDLRPQLLKPWEAAAKRLLDILVAGLLVLMGLPVWIFASLMIKMDSKGPVFYRQERVGKDGVRFKVLKFRSMRTVAERQSGPVWAGKDDPRVTRMGRILRKTHLDEIPQFWNVLVGDMSLVGPRPERPYFVERLSKEIPMYRHRHQVKPGITGWAQIKHKYDESIDDVRAKVRFDLFYIENMSWRLDLIILFNTFYVMLRGKGHT
ncbi:MAG: sugar transferase [Ignavibacteriales bacterium]|nr:sugar transferase [Ignavibacteriales bacterium]